MSKINNINSLKDIRTYPEVTFFTFNSLFIKLGYSLVRPGIEPAAVTFA